MAGSATCPRALSPGGLILRKTDGAEWDYQAGESLRQRAGVLRLRPDKPDEFTPSANAAAPVEAGTNQDDRITSEKTS